MPLLYFVNNNTIDFKVSNLDDQALLFREVVETYHGEERRVLNKRVLFIVGFGRTESTWEYLKPKGNMILGYKERESLVLAQKGISLSQFNIVTVHDVCIHKVVIKGIIGYYIDPFIFIGYHIVEVIQGQSRLQREMSICFFNEK